MNSTAACINFGFGEQKLCWPVGRLWVPYSVSWSSMEGLGRCCICKAAFTLALGLAILDHSPYPIMESGLAGSIQSCCQMQPVSCILSVMHMVATKKVKTGIEEGNLYLQHPRKSDPPWPMTITSVNAARTCSVAEMLYNEWNRKVCSFFDVFRKFQHCFIVF